MSESVCLSVCPLACVKNSKSATVAVSKLGCGNVIFVEATVKINRDHTDACVTEGGAAGSSLIRGFAGDCVCLHHDGVTGALCAIKLDSMR